MKNMGKEKKKRSGLRRIVSRVMLALFIFFGICFNLCVIANIATVLGASDDIYVSIAPEDYDCIIVLGAGVREDGTLSDMLRDRMDTAIDLYMRADNTKMIVTGDHGRESYDEVNAMKAYAVSCGVCDEDVFMDHAGFSTYESIVRAREVFGVERAVVVTQRYHLYRALYICEYVGIDAMGICADVRQYRGAYYREAREVLARTNDFIKQFTRPGPKYLGESISLGASGNITNDK